MNGKIRRVLEEFNTRAISIDDAEARIAELFENDEAKQGALKTAAHAFYRLDNLQSYENAMREIIGYLSDIDTQDDNAINKLYHRLNY